MFVRILLNKLYITLFPNICTMTMIDKTPLKLSIISLVSVLLILSMIPAVFASAVAFSPNHLESQPDGPPEGVGPVRPDPGEMSRRIGAFEEEIGSFVSFEPMEEGISNHSIRVGEDEYLTIFDEVSIEEFGKYDERDAGPTYFLRGIAAEFQLYDTPTTLLKLDVYSLGESGRDVSFRLGDMDDIEVDEKEVRISNEVYSGSLIYLDRRGQGQQGPEERNDFTIENDDLISFTVEERATFIFRMEMDGFEGRIRNFLRERIRKGRIGAEFRIESKDEGYIHKSTSYRDVDMKAQMRDENTLEMLVSSDTLDEGTLLLLDISSTVMEISSKEDIDLHFDGELAEFVEKDNIEELDESDEPSYTLIQGDEGTHILVNVPTFSTHSITVEYITETLDQYLGSLIYYIPAAIGSVGLVLFGLLYKKRDKKEEKKKDNNKRVSIGRHPKNYKKDKGNEKRIKGDKEDKEKETRVRKD